MKKTIEEIYSLFGKKLVGNDKMKYHVCEILTIMEDDIIDYITKNCWFFASFDDAWAFTLTGNDLKDYHLILLSDDLLSQPSSQIHYTIAHEIGHVILGHKNAILESQSKQETKRQEQEADAFARKYINN